MFQELKKRKLELENQTKKKLHEEYGGDEHVAKVPPKALLVGQSEVSSPSSSS